ncbi:MULTISPECIES: hypothetical protein [unclassified Rhizobium]|uniref:hypothetical protein n=1 Tax=unclassified Rhizobium TaxID=2613769 RepID=UPI002B25AB96|nr:MULTISPECIES: hypothetical protein [unclassified Rhizobium]
MAIAEISAFHFSRSVRACSTMEAWIATGAAAGASCADAKVADDRKLPRRVSTATIIAARAAFRRRPDKGPPNIRLPSIIPPNINRTSMPFISSSSIRLFTACRAENHPQKARFSGVYLAFHPENHHLQ